MLADLSAASVSKTPAKVAGILPTFIFCSVLGGFGILGFILVCSLTSKFGPGITTDSVKYLSCAEGLRGGELAFTVFDGSHYDQWPPLYPALLAFLIPILGSVEASSQFLNAACFGSLIMAAGFFLNRYCASRWCVWLGVLSVCLNFSLCQVSSYAMSEPLFNLLILGTLLALDRFLERPDALTFTGLIFFSSAACLTRYLGVAFVLTAVTLMFVQRIGVKTILAYAVSASLPLLLWVANIYSFSGSLGSGRFAAQRGFWENLGDAFMVFTSLGASDQRGSILGFASRALVLGIFLIAFFSWRRKRRAAMKKGITLPVWPRSAMLFCAMYTVILVVTVSLVKCDSITGRFFTPVAAPMILVLCWLLAAGKKGLEDSSLGRKWAWWGGYGALAGLTVVLSGWQLINYSSFVQSRGAGGYNTKSWRESELVRWIQENPLEGEVYSNAPPALYWLTGQVSTRMARRPEELQEFEDNPNGEAASTWLSSTILRIAEVCLVEDCRWPKSMGSFLVLWRCDRFRMEKFYGVPRADDREGRRSNTMMMLSSKNGVEYRD